MECKSSYYSTEKTCPRCGEANPRWNQKPDVEFVFEGMKNLSDKIKRHDRPRKRERQKTRIRAIKKLVKRMQ